MIGALDYDLENLVRAHEATGAGLCTLFLLDVDNYHQKTAPLKENPSELPLLEELLTWIEGSLPGRPALYHHGRDSLLAVYWNRAINDVLPLLYAWHAVVPSQVFGAGTANLSFTLTASVGEHPTHADGLRKLLRVLEDCLFDGKRGGKGRIVIAFSGPMVLKSSYYSATQLRRLAALAQREGATEATLLREALDLILRKYDDRSPA